MVPRRTEGSTRRSKYWSFPGRRRCCIRFGSWFDCSFGCLGQCRKGGRCTRSPTKVWHSDRTRPQASRPSRRHSQHPLSLHLRRPLWGGIRHWRLCHRLSQRSRPHHSPQRLPPLNASTRRHCRRRMMPNRSSHPGARSPQRPNRRTSGRGRRNATRVQAARTSRGGSTLRKAVQMNSSRSLQTSTFLHGGPTAGVTMIVVARAIAPSLSPL